MNQIRDVVNLDTKAFIMFSDLIKQFYEVKSDALKILGLKLSHLKSCICCLIIMESINRKLR